jgi:hypothetical protein
MTSPVCSYLARSAALTITLPKRQIKRDGGSNTLSCKSTGMRARILAEMLDAAACNASAIDKHAGSSTAHLAFSSSSMLIRAHLAARRLFDATARRTLLLSLSADGYFGVGGDWRRELPCRSQDGGGGGVGYAPPLMEHSLSGVSIGRPSQGSGARLRRGCSRAEQTISAAFRVLQ